MKQVTITKKCTILIIFFSTIISAIADSDKIFNNSNNHYYQRIDQIISWHDSKKYCENFGGYLSTITSKEENDFIFYQLISDSNSKTTYCWLGGTDEKKEGKWEWITGEEWRFTNWKNGEPNNLGNEDFLHSYITSNAWNDIPKDCEGIFICEWDSDNISDKFLITSPKNNSIVVDSVIIVSGMSKSEAIIELVVNNTFSKTCTASTTGLFSLSDIKLNEGQNLLQIRLSNSDVNSYSMIVMLDPIPNPPENINKSTDDTSITISWNQNQESDIHGYNIYRDNKKLNTNTILSNSFTDYWLINGKEYTYIVTAVDSYGSESLKTSKIKAMPIATYKWNTQ